MQRRTPWGSLALLAGVVCVGCAASVGDRAGAVDRADAARGIDAARAERGCEDGVALDLTRFAERFGSIVRASFDTRDAPFTALPYSPSPCAVRRDRAAVFVYAAPRDGWVRVTSSAVVEVFSGCQPDASMLTCARPVGGAQTVAWVRLRAAEPVRLVVTNVDTAFGESSEGVVGSLTLQTLDPLPEGAPCAESDALGPAVCGPGARCVDGRCAVITTPPRCYPSQSTCASGTVCNAAGRCASARSRGEACDAEHPCAPALRCVSAGIGRTRCASPRRVGEPCGLNGFVCEAGLWCDPERGCLPPRPLGAPCGPAVCVPGAACAEGACRRVERRPWGPCDARDVAPCPAGHVCVAGRCQPAEAREDERCEETRGPFCVEGLRCIAGGCAGPGRYRRGCRWAQDCPVGEVCGPSQFCGAPGTDGQSCREDVPRCVDGGRCRAGICLAAVARCTPFLSGSPCAPGRSCVASDCREDGAFDARCRQGAAAAARGLCDPGLRCADGVCARVVAEGEICGSITRTACAEGASCVSMAVRGVCVQNGATSGRCRVEQGREVCDAGLKCVEGHCLRAIRSVGERCDAPGETCVDGASCTLDTRQCIRDGDVGGRCRRGDAPCDSGLRCNARAEPRCVASAELGATCGLHRRCGVGQTCGFEGRCVSAGSFGSRCEARCDPGLACRTTGATGFCATVVGPESRCDETTVCADGLFCRNDGCEPELGHGPGGDGGLCRIEAPFCDEGLRCERFLHCERAGGAQVGEGCDEVTRCESPSTCFNRLCREVGRVGGACRDSAPPCEAGLFCDGERCQMSQAPGSACVTPRAPCAPGHTCVSLGGVSRCTADGQPGARCRFDRDAICDEGARCVPGRAVCLP